MITLQKSATINASLASFGTSETKITQSTEIVVHVETNQESIDSVKNYIEELKEGIKKIPNSKIPFSSVEKIYLKCNDLKQSKSTLDSVISDLMKVDSEVLTEAKDVCILLDNLNEAKKLVVFLLTTYENAMLVSIEKEKMKDIEAISYEELILKLA